MKLSSFVDDMTAYVENAKESIKRGNREEGGEGETERDMDRERKGGNKRNKKFRCNLN